MLLMTGAIVAPARADLTHRMSSSTQLQVNGAYTDASRIGSTYTVSGSNIKVATDAHFGKLTAGTATAAATLDVGAYDVNTAGSAFSFAQSYTQGDAVSTSAPTVGTVGNFSSQVSTAAGTKDTLAGTITSAGVTTITGGGAGTSATGQFVSELTIK